MKINVLLFGFITITSMAASAQVEAIKTQRLIPSWVTAEQMHLNYTERVINSPGAGASRMPAVFQSVTELKLDQTEYHMNRVGLIGIAEHTTPVAFISPTSVPRLADLTNATFRARIQQRPLTAFETNALPQLRAGRETVMDLKAGLVVGAVRAREDCLKCHEGKVGTLLGALSYEMTPAAKRDLLLQQFISRLENPKTAGRAGIAKSIAAKTP